MNLENEIKELIAGILEIDKGMITPGARFVEDLGMDSMMALEILASIEKKYNIQIPEEKLAKLNSLKDTVELTREYIDPIK